MPAKAGSQWVSGPLKANHDQTFFPMITLSPSTFSSPQHDKVDFEQNPNSSDRQGSENRQQSNDMTYGRERLQISDPSRETNQFRSLPTLGRALTNLYAGRLKSDIMNSLSGVALMRNSKLIAERVLHFTSKQSKTD
jgi:hypothetical protein